MQTIPKTKRHATRSHKIRGGGVEPLHLLVLLLLLLEIILLFCVILRTAPARRTARALHAGERYLAVPDHGKAAAAFRQALTIDPGNIKCRRIVQDHFLHTLAAADKAASKQDYEQALRLSELVAGFEDILGDDDPIILSACKYRREYVKQREVVSLLSQAESEFRDSDYGNAALFYDLAAEKGAAESDLEPNRSLSRVYDEILGLAGEDRYGELAALLNGPDAAVLASAADAGIRRYINDRTFLEQDKDLAFIVYGGLDRERGDGTATAVISGTNTNSVYHGEWIGFHPEGTGELSVWLKDEGIADSAFISGTFHEGLCDGVGVYGFGGSDDKPLIEETAGTGDWRQIPGTDDPSYEQAAMILDTLDWDIEAAFDWSAGLTYYGHGKTDMPETPDPGTRWFASYGFTNGKGNCFVMAATFFEFARLCGYEPRQMCGMVPSRKGGLTIHSWVEIDSEGRTYVYDPDFQYNKGLDGFGLQYGQQGTWKYQDYSQMSE